jgi:uncharacterized protein (TIGR04255 family)
MERKSLGQLKNAPLAYVLAEIRTDQFDFAVHGEAIWESLYPLYQGRAESASNVIKIEPSGIAVEHPKRYELSAKDQREGVILQQSSVVLHATHYETSDEFLARLQEVLDAIKKVIPNLPLVNRLGIRYVDIIVPEPAERPGDYVIPMVRGIFTEDGKNDPIYARYQTTFLRDSGILNFRYAVHQAGMPELSEDLIPISLAASEVMENARESGRPFGILDFDSFAELREDFDPTAIKERFRILQKSASDLFRSIQTDRAREVWGVPKGEGASN